jgi:uncharacterized protein YggE
MATMKTIRLLITIFITLITTVFADIDVRRHIEVSGTALVLIEPDYATWAITIRGEADSLAEASRNLEQSTSALKASLLASGFKDEIIRFSAISSGRHYVVE